MIGYWPNRLRVVVINQHDMYITQLNQAFGCGEVVNNRFSGDGVSGLSPCMGDLSSNLAFL